MRFDERLAVQELEDLEAAFLKVAEDSRRPETTKKNAMAKTWWRRAGMTRREQAATKHRGVWRRLAGYLGQVKERARDLLLCCAHATDGTSLDTDDDGVQEVLPLLDNHENTLLSAQVSPSSRERTASVVSLNDAVLPPCAFVPHTPRHMRQSTAASPFDESVEDTPESWSFESIREEVYGEEEEEKSSESLSEIGEDDAFLTPRVLRAKRGFAKAVHQDLESERFCRDEFSVNWERAAICKRFTRVRLALKCVFALHQLMDERKETSSRVIQRAWHNYRQRCVATSLTKEIVESSTPESDDVLLSTAHVTGTKRPHDMVESETALGDGSLQSLSSSGNEGYELLECSKSDSNVLVSELLQHEGLFTIKRRATLPISSSLFAIQAPVVQDVEMTAEVRAVRTIQSFWRHELAKRRDDDLRRLSEYELETQSVMPIIRTQMSVVRQRLDELRRREDGLQDVKFDDEWL